MDNESANDFPQRPLMSRTTTFLVVIAAALFFAWLIRGLALPLSPVTDHLGQPFPEIVVQGWLNGPPPTPAEMEGKVRVIEAWAYWCGPCATASPHLRELYDQYHDRGVVFLGLTSEGKTTLANSRKFLEEGNITWPNGYGADPTISVLYPDGMGIPHMWVVDREGKIAWEGHPLALSPQLLDGLL